MEESSRPGMKSTRAASTSSRKTPRFFISSSRIKVAPTISSLERTLLLQGGSTLSSHCKAIVSLTMADVQSFWWVPRANSPAPNKFVLLLQQARVLPPRMSEVKSTDRLGTHSQRRSSQRRAAPSCCYVARLGLYLGCRCVTPRVVGVTHQPNAH